MKYLRYLLLTLLSLLALLVLAIVLLLKFPQTFISEEWLISYVKDSEYTKELKWDELSLKLGSSEGIGLRFDLKVLGLNGISRVPSASIKLTDTNFDFSIKVGWGFEDGFRFDPLGIANVDSTAIEVVLLEDEVSPIRDESKKSEDSTPWKEVYQKIFDLPLPGLNVQIERLSVISNQASLVDTQNLVVKWGGELQVQADVILPGGEWPKLHLDASLSRETAKLGILAEAFQLPEQSIQLLEPKLEVYVKNLNELQSFSSFELQMSAVSKIDNKKVSKSFKEAKTSLMVKGALAANLLEKVIKDLEVELLAVFGPGNIQFRGHKPTFKIAEEISELQKEVVEFLARSELSLTVPNVKKFLLALPTIYNELPAPLSLMNGDMSARITFESLKDPRSMKVVVPLVVNLSGENQELHFRTDASAEVKLKDAWDVEVQNTSLRVELGKIRILLPKVNARHPVTQIVPDSRMKIASSEPDDDSKAKKKRSKSDLQLIIATKQPLVFSTSQLKEDLKFSIDLMVSELGPEKGYVELLPMDLEILRRPIQVRKARVDWRGPEDGLIDAKIIFPLPEYKIFLDVQGHLEAPFWAFRSEPPLPEDDIYSVLLFGQPMSEIDASNAKGVSGIRSSMTRGVFSLATLYLLAGTRIQSVVYDPESSAVKTSIRLTSKSSLQLGVEQGGVESVGVRRPLGNGWYVESTAKSSSKSRDSSSNYGLMLQKIIAY